MHLVDEYQTAQFPDANVRTVRYGHPSHGWYQKDVTKWVNCSSWFFDYKDPAPGVAKTCDVKGSDSIPAPTPAPAPAPVPAPPPMPGAVWIDVNKIPAGSPGINRDTIEPASESPYWSDGTGAFRTICDYSHMNFDDAIVAPGQQGASHLHTYFGNKDANASSTAQSLLNNGVATCRGGTTNRSAYWIPSIVDSRDGRPIAADRMIVYYKTGYWGVKPGEVQNFPTGLRMIAGSSGSQVAQSTDVVRWTCSNDSTPRAGIPTSCPVGATVGQVIRFPQCWDGKNLDSTDHRSHVAYPKLDYPYGCPSTHPVPLPEVSFVAEFTVKSTDDLRSWRLSSDRYDTTQPGGYSNHADWFNGWKPEVMNVWMTQCVRKGLDCKGALLGDGRQLAGTYNEGMR